MRVGVVFPGDAENPTTWSGTPYGVLTALRELGIDAVSVNVDPWSSLTREIVRTAMSVPYLRPSRDLRGTLKLARAAGRASPPMGTLHAWTASRALERVGHLDGLIQIGSGYRLATSTPYVTFEDITIRLMRSHPYHDFELLSEKAADKRIATQSAVYSEAVACCTTSPWAAESIITDYGVAPRKVHVVGVGANRKALPTERDWSEPRFLFVGLNWRLKNGGVVLRAFDNLLREIPNARLDVVGGHPRLNRPGVTGHGVLRLGDPDDSARLEHLFARATCFVMPSEVDASAIAYVEAASAGLPLIGTKSGGSDFLIGAGGVVIEPTDEGALLDTMRRFANPDTAALVGHAAQERSQLFTWRKVAQRLLRALDGHPPQVVTEEFVP